MTTDSAPARSFSSERGTAIVMVLLLLMVMSALAAALSVSGTTETMVTRNHQTAAQALTAAEAGLNHAAQVFIEHMKLIDPLFVDDELDAILADPTLLDIAFGTEIAIAGANETVTYNTSLMDEDDADRGADASNLDEDGDATNDEDGDETLDNNRKLIIRSTGTGPNNTVVTLEAVLAPYDYGALVTDGDLDISGSVDIDGTSEQSVHSNGDLTISGSGGSFSGDVEASGTYSGAYSGTSGAAEVPMPNVDPADYRHHADFILTSSGTMTNAAGTLLCTWSAKTSCNSWDFDAANGTWSIANSVKTATNGTYYVEGDVVLNGSPGDSVTPWAVTLIAEGSIDISGSPDIIADTDELLLVAGGDLEISGGLDNTNPLSAQGQIMVHEQIKLSGNPSIYGQIIVEDAEDVADLVTENEISGNVSITYNGGLGSNLFSVTGWREVR